MDFTRLNQGEKVAGASGVLLILIMFIFKWFGLKASVGVTGISVVNAEVTRNAWGSYGFIDIVLFITALAAIGLALLAASEGDVGLPVAASAIVAGLGILSVILVIISIISPPDFGVDVSGVGIDHMPPYISAAVRFFGHWSTVPAEYTTGSAARPMNRPTYRPSEKLWAVGLPT